MSGGKGVGNHFGSEGDRAHGECWFPPFRARTIADLDARDQVARPHIAEALSFRRIAPERR